MAEYTWPSREATAVIGKEVDRLDGMAKATGAAKYTYDVNLKNQLIAVALGCPHAHCKITKLDVSAAEKTPGVVAVHIFEHAAVGREVELSAYLPDDDGERPAAECVIISGNLLHDERGEHGEPKSRSAYPLPVRLTALTHSFFKSIPKKRSSCSPCSPSTSYFTNSVTRYAWPPHSPIVPKTIIRFTHRFTNKPICAIDACCSKLHQDFDDRSICSRIANLFLGSNVE